MLLQDDEVRDDTRLEPPSETAEEQSAEPLEPAPPITNRFLLVNVAARRAKQLRRGASPRLDDEALTRLGPAKAERLAMEEVRRGLVYYDQPEWTRASS